MGCAFLKGRKGFLYRSYQGRWIGFWIRPEGRKEEKQACQWKNYEVGMKTIWNASTPVHTAWGTSKKARNLGSFPELLHHQHKWMNPVASVLWWLFTDSSEEISRAGEVVSVMERSLCNGGAGLYTSVSCWVQFERCYLGTRYKLVQKTPKTSSLFVFPSTDIKQAYKEWCHPKSVTCE